jgi:hypothetical protein
MKKIIAILITLMLVATIGAGCAARKMESAAAEEPDYAPSVYPEAASAADMAYDEYYEAEESSYSVSEMNLENEANAGSVTQNKKIIRNADCAITVKSATEAWAKITEAVTAAGGYVSESSQWQSGDNYISINATIRIPSGKLDTAIDFLQNLGELENLNISSSDVTSEYTDTQLRLDVKRSSLTQYYKYLEAAESVDEMLKIQRSINDLVEEIESAEGMLRLWDNLVSESTLQIRIYEEEDETRTRREAEWNAMTGDATLGRVTVGSELRNVKMNRTNAVMLLCHGTKAVTLKAMPKIIKYYKKHGYTFKTITSSTPTYHQHIAN